jgi:alanine-synthesizing transaminase
MRNVDCNKMIRPADRIANYHYAIRDIVAAATALEQQGKEIYHLNIGDPQAFGFRPPANLVETVSAALRDRFTGYAHSQD